MPHDWRLAGRAVIAVQRARPELTPTFRRNAFRGGLSAIMAVRYTASPVGPYSELLYVAGLFGAAGGTHPSVTRILVDSEASARAGREHWGLPKELAGFEWRGTHLRVTQGGRLVAELAWNESAFTLPATSGLLPAAWRTLAQPRGERHLLTQVAGRGLVRPARLRQLLINPALFPPVGPHPLVALSVPRFRMHFPAPDLH